MLIFQVGSVFFLVYANLKIHNYKRKHATPPQVITPMNINFFSFENEALESIIFNGFIILLLAEVTFVINKINLLKPIECNIFPNYLYVNVFQLVNPVVVIGIGFSIYFWKHSRMRNHLLREIKERMTNSNLIWLIE